MTKHVLAFVGVVCVIAAQLHAQTSEKTIPLHNNSGTAFLQAATPSENINLPAQGNSHNDPVFNVLNGSFHFSFLSEMRDTSQAGFSFPLDLSKVQNVGYVINGIGELFPPVNTGYHFGQTTLDSINFFIEPIANNNFHNAHQALQIFIAPINLVQDSATGLKVVLDSIFNSPSLNYFTIPADTLNKHTDISANQLQVISWPIPQPLPVIPPGKWFFVGFQTGDPSDTFYFPARFEDTLAYVPHGCIITETNKQYDTVRTLYTSLNFVAGSGRYGGLPVRFDWTLWFGGDFDSTISAVNQNPKLLPSLVTLGNYPNPVQQSAYIRYTLETSANVTLRVYDALGRAVATLAEGYRATGTHNEYFDASALPNGVYSYVLTKNGRSVSRLMTVMH